MALPCPKDEYPKVCIKYRRVAEGSNSFLTLVWNKEKEKEQSVDCMTLYRLPEMKLVKEIPESL